MRTRYIIYSWVTTLTLLSCVKEPYEQPKGGTGDEAATRITLAIKSDHRQSVGSKSVGAHSNNAAILLNSLPSLVPASRALTSEQEGVISNVHILVFDAEGAVAGNEHFDNLTITGTGKISLETLPGDGMQIVVVANGDVNDHKGTTLDEKLKSITTLDELKAVLVDTDGDGLSRTDRLMMVGSATTNITKPHSGEIPVELGFLDTKVTLTVKDNIPAEESITITGWDVVNIPKKSYLKERTTPEDAVVGNTPGDYTATSGKYSFESSDAAAKTWTHTVYLFENRRGSRVDRADPTNTADKYPGMSVTDNDQRGKAWYAPAGATYMLIYGTYTKGEQMNNVVYKVFLGENPINDYNLFRGKHYNYNVTINGLNNINVDTNVEWGSASFSVDKSDNLMMDAHPDFRVFRIGGTAVDASTPAYATVEVLETDGITPCSWLTVSPMNLYRHGIKQSGNADQQFASGDGVGSYVRTKYTATPITDESEFSVATFAITRKLTKIPFNQPAVYTYQNAIVYADAYDGTADRTAKVKITYYRGADGTEQAGQLIYDITQSGAIKISDDLYIERYEESAMLIHPGLTSGLQNTATMQWGYNDATLYAADDRFTNGNYLTANAVYNTVAARNDMDAPSWIAINYAAYREKYPRTGKKVTEPSTLNTTGEPYYYPELNSGIQPYEYFHPIFNSSAARYCHEKNRDKNGDGIISAEETEWYLPSFADMWYITKNMPIELTLTGTYWTATEESNTNSWSYKFPTPTPSSSIKNTPYRVRCVRGNGVVLPDAKIESTETDNTKINLASTAKGTGEFNITDNTGLTWTVTSSDQSWLKIATTATGSGAIASVTGAAAKTLYAYVANANTSPTAARTATITLTRPGMISTPAKIITVTQARTISASTVTPTALTLPFRAGGSVAFTIDNKSSGLEWTVTVSEDSQSWLAIATDDIGMGAAVSKTGDDNAKLYAYSATQNPDPKTARSATITFSRAEQTDVIIKVVQNTQETFPPMHKGWAGCNVYWDDSYVNSDNSIGRLTFTDVGDRTKEKIQGVFFKWGSLVAIAPLETAFSPQNSILFSPNGKTYEKYTDIQSPKVAGGNDLVENGGSRAILIDLHDPINNVGDICKYITERGWAPGATGGKTWRLPTYDEIGRDFIDGQTTGCGVYPTYEKGDRNGTTPMKNLYRTDLKSGNVIFPYNGGQNYGFVYNYNGLMPFGYHISSAQTGYNIFYISSLNRIIGGRYEINKPSSNAGSLTNNGWTGGIRCVLE